MKKSIIYMLIAVLLSSIVFSAITVSNKKLKNVVELQCIEQTIDTNALAKSAEIIYNRLNAIGYTKFELMVSNQTNSILIHLHDLDELNNIRELLISKGEINFYETYHRNQILDKIDKGDKVFELLNIPESPKMLESTAILGTCNRDQIPYVIEHIYSLGIDSVKYSWGKFSTINNEWNLYLLKNESAIDQNNISAYMAVDELKTETNDLMLVFENEAIGQLQNLTKNNMNKPIAMVVDNLVYHSPVVKAELKGGKSRISGDFTKDDNIKLMAFINHGELPLKFRINQ